MAESRIMQLLIRIFGPPHEGLHLLALWLIGRRAIDFGSTYVDIPEDLTMWQYIFVAGLPAIVFWGTAALGVTMLLNARIGGDLIVGFALLMLGTLGGLGTGGDIQLIIARVTEEQNKPPPQ